MFLVKIVILYFLVYISFKLLMISKILEMFVLFFKCIFKVVMLDVTYMRIIG